MSDPRYACRLYCHAFNKRRFLLVCEQPKEAVILRMSETWRHIVSGFQPPDKARPWLKLQGFYETWDLWDEVPEAST